MRSIWIATLLCATGLPMMTVNAEEAAPVAPPAAMTPPAPAAPTAEETRNAIETVSYMIGLQVGGEMSEQYIELDPQLVAKGVADAAAGKQPELKDEDLRSAAMTLQKVARAKATAMAAKNKADGEAFLTKNKDAEGVKTTASGLQYKVIAQGDGKGKQPVASDQVTVHYKGTLLDGTEFDSSYKRGEPATFPLGGVIKGWTEGLQLMRVGDKYQLFVPYQLAYGEQGRGKTIPPASLLVFEVELKDVQPAPAPAPGMGGFPGMPQQ